MLTGEELDVLRGIASGMQNASTYGYELAVKGTVIDGVASLICGIITVISVIYIGKKLLAWAKTENKSSYNDGFSYVLAGFGIVISLIVISLVVNSVAYEPFMKIFAPEYTVVKQILAAAANVAT